MAVLARLGLRPDEARRLKEDFRRILAFVRILEGLDPGRIPPSIFPLDLRLLALIRRALG